MITLIKCTESLKYVMTVIILLKVYPTRWCSTHHLLGNISLLKLVSETNHNWNTDNLDDQDLQTKLNHLDSEMHMLEVSSVADDNISKATNLKNRKIGKGYYEVYSKTKSKS